MTPTRFGTIAWAVGHCVRPHQWKVSISVEAYEVGAPDSEGTAAGSRHATLAEFQLTGAINNRGQSTRLHGSGDPSLGLRALSRQPLIHSCGSTTVQLTWMAYCDFQKNLGHGLLGRRIEVADSLRPSPLGGTSGSRRAGRRRHGELRDEVWDWAGRGWSLRSIPSMGLGTWGATTETGVQQSRWWYRTQWPTGAR